MNIDNKRDTEIRYYLFLLAVVGGYSLYFLSFTLFDGFATFSNDAASYVLMGRKWSLFFEPTPAEVFTWPAHPYPPAFAALLAITGASESLWASHLVVSLCLLASLLLIGHYLRKQTDLLIASLVTVAIVLIPGIIINSLGILSENLYLLVSLGALSVYLHIRNRRDTSWFSYLALFLLLASSILSRTIGIALIGAFLLAPVFDRTLIPRQRVILPMVALGGIFVWQLWEAIKPLESQLSYDLYLSGILNSKRESLMELLLPLWRSANLNLVRLLGSWSQYWAINSGSGASFLFTYLLLMICVTGLVLRAVRMRLDAVYVLFYVSIILLWPVSEQMSRFLHPIAFLLLLQPVILLSERGYLKAGSRAYYAVASIGLVLIVHSALIQVDLLNSKRRAEHELPALAHSPEYYLASPDNGGMGLARTYASIAELMVQSAEFIPSDSIVASTKHENFSLLADRKAVALTGSVPMYQQLCNLKLELVNYVYLTNIATTLNLLGLTLLDHYEPYTADSWSRISEDETSIAYILEIDQSALAVKLDGSGLACEEIRLVN